MVNTTVHMTASIKQVKTNKLLGSDTGAADCTTSTGLVTFTISGLLTGDLLDLLPTQPNNISNTPDNM